MASANAEHVAAASTPPQNSTSVTGIPTPTSPVSPTLKPAHSDQSTTSPQISVEAGPLDQSDHSDPTLSHVNTSPTPIAKPNQAPQQHANIPVQYYVQPPAGAQSGYYMDPAATAQYGYYMQQGPYYFGYPAQYWPAGGRVGIGSSSGSVDQVASAAGSATPSSEIPGTPSPSDPHPPEVGMYSPTVYFHPPPAGYASPHHQIPMQPPFSPTLSVGSETSQGIPHHLPATPQAAAIPHHSPYRIPMASPQMVPHVPPYMHHPARARRPSDPSFGSPNPPPMPMRPLGGPVGLGIPVSPMQTHHQMGQAMLQQGPSRGPGIMGMGAMGSLPAPNTNVYIRNLPHTMSDQMLYTMCQPFGKIVSSKSIIDRATNMCRGYGFVMYETEWQAKTAIDGITKMGFSASFAKQEPLNVRARPQQVQTHQQHQFYPPPYNNNNIYLANLPADMTEQSLMDLFRDWSVQSTKILIDSDTGASRGIGFARFPSSAQAQEVITRFNNATLPGCESPLQVRWADPRGGVAIPSFPVVGRGFVRGAYPTQPGRRRNFGGSGGRGYMRGGYGSGRAGYMHGHSGPQAASPNPNPTLPRLSSTEWPPLHGINDNVNPSGKSEQLDNVSEELGSQPEHKQSEEAELEALTKMVRDKLGVGKLTDADRPEEEEENHA